MKGSAPPSAIERKKSRIAEAKEHLRGIKTSQKALR
jgi:hypothetical protein